ncbi:DMT family transporter [Alkalilacustris brevis]|uniref:DMT family transporter n=1 Tax=Alkalilacustris brevis TaxID=2026338 RepID=UPI000E0DA187|nr:DMT family transporter [Alkalilacustris brevis]
MTGLGQLDRSETSLAIATICAGVAFLVCSDAIAKLLTERYDPIQIVFLRNLIAVPIIALGLAALRGRHALRTNHLRLHALRGLIMVIGAYLFFTGLSFLPLAEATALVFSAPIFITALSVPLLGEAVGWRRWGAVLLGFVGVLVVVQPGGAAFQPASLLVVGTALCYALFMISSRWIGRDESLWTMMLFVMLFPMIYAAPFAMAYWTPPVPGDIGLFLAIAVFGSLGITLIAQAFRLAPAAVVAPFDYTALIWATGLGWLIWGDIPALWTMAGAAIIIASGLIILLRETRQKKR